MQHKDILDNQQNISNEQMIELAARLKFQSQKEYSETKLINTTAKATVAIGVGSFIAGSIGYLNEMHDLSQNALAIGLYGTLSGIGLCGVSGRNSNFAYDKELISNHIVDALIQGVDFSNCANIMQAVDLVGQHVHNKELAESPQPLTYGEYERYYQYGSATFLCEKALQKQYSLKSQLKIDQTRNQIIDHIAQQSSLTNIEQTSQPNIHNERYQYESLTTLPTPQEDFCCK